MLSKEVSSTIFWVFGMTRLGIEPRSPELLANTLPTRPHWYSYRLKEFQFFSADNSKYQDGLKSSWHICSWWLLNNGIQTLQHWYKKCVGCKGDYVEKLIVTFYLAQSMNFSANPHINLISSCSIRVSWSAYDLSSQPLYKPLLVTLVNIWIF